MASSFELSNSCSFVDAFTDVGEGPPKKLILPKHDLITAHNHRKLTRVESLQTQYRYVNFFLLYTQTSRIHRHKQLHMLMANDAGHSPNKVERKQKQNRIFQENKNYH